MCVLFILGIVAREQFLVFHADGYTVYDPLRCLLKRSVPASLKSVISGGGVQTLCNNNKCVWGSAVTAGDKLVYVSQPMLNRILVLDISELSNPIEVRWHSVIYIEVRWHSVIYIEVRWHSIVSQCLRLHSWNSGLYLLILHFIASKV